MAEQVALALARLEKSFLRREKIISPVERQHISQGKSDKCSVEPPSKSNAIREFFLADMFDFSLKCDSNSLQAPIFSLSTKLDTRVWEWRSKDGKSYIRVVPSVLGRATQHDKDILIFAISQLVEGLNRGRADAKNRTVRFKAHDLLVTTNRQVSGDGYRRLREALERLCSTTILTNIHAGGRRFSEGFGLLDKWRIVEHSDSDTRMAAIDITLSEWLFSAVRSLDVLTLDPAYFQLRSPLSRRIYEIARKQCGSKPQWTIGLELLRARAGSFSTPREFRRKLRAIEKGNDLPGYQLKLDAGDKVTFYSVQTTKPRNGTKSGRIDSA